MSFPNTFHSDKWQLTFSNIPSVGAVGDMKYFDNYVKSVVLPDYNLIEGYSDLKSERLRHPMSRTNEDLSQLQIEFKLSEDMTNYLKLLEWMLSLRYAPLNPENISEEKLYDEVIKTININILDNQKRMIANMKFSQARLLNLSSMGLDTGSSEEVTFTCNFSYEEIQFDTFSIN